MTDLIQEKINLAQHTSWQVGGPADFFAQPKDLEELKLVLSYALERNLPWTVLGGGTNVLVSDRGVRGLVIALSKFKGMQEEVEGGRLIMTAFSGTAKSELLKRFLLHKLAPALFLAGLPGDVGGGVVMNAGIAEAVLPREFCELVEWIEVLRPEKSLPLKRISKSELTISYRHCEGWRPGIITRVQFSWPLEPNPEILKEVRTANQVRLSRQPLDMPSCGSVFINPPNNKSGRLIEEAGLKGLQIGGAQVSNKHANFIVNTGSAAASDIDRVIKAVQSKVLERSGIELRTEVVYLGEW